MKAQSEKSAWESLADTNDLGQLVQHLEAPASAGETTSATFVNDFPK